MVGKFATPVIYTYRMSQKKLSYDVIEMTLRSSCNRKDVRGNAKKMSTELEKAMLYSKVNIAVATDTPCLQILRV